MNHTQLILFDLDGTLLNTTLRNQALFTFKPQASRGQLYEGALEILSLVETRYRWGIVTNKSALGAEQDLRHFGLWGRQSVLVGGDTLEVCKPDPAPVLHACEQAGVLPHRALFVGDGYADYEAAKGAGVRFIFCTYGYSKTLPPHATPFAHIHQLTDLAHLLELS
ncbi:MAG: HAD-IA family hydrolase [Cardiobacteriaceae bacterium]|nr:HAD-IA family hydrolase [Cardiobacteriaceae bacterium]